MFNIHKAVDLKFGYIIIYCLKQNRHNKVKLSFKLLKMNDIKEQQSAENEFLKDNLQNDLSTNTIKSFILSKRYVRDLLNEQIQIVEKSNAEATTSEIIQNSRIRIVHKRSNMSQQFKGVKNQKCSRFKIKEFQAEQMLKVRFSEYKNKINRKIGEIEIICDKKFGGIDAITKEMTKNALTRQQLVEYYAKMLPKNVNLHKISAKDINLDMNNKERLQFPKIRSQSQKNISRAVNKNLSPLSKQSSKFNKWYIDPTKRFLLDKQKTKYDWRTQDGVKNVIRTQILSVPGKQIKQLVSQIKNKFNRAPLFCKYAKFS